MKTKQKETNRKTTQTKFQSLIVKTIFAKTFKRVNKYQPPAFHMTWK